MRLIVADAYGYGVHSNSDAGAHELSPDEWTEIDVRDEIIATFGEVVVRYRDTGREVTVPTGTTYRIEYENNDVIDVRTAETSTDELLEALGASPPHPHRVLNVLHALHVGNKIDEFSKEAYEHRTGVTLETGCSVKLQRPRLARSPRVARHR